MSAELASAHAAQNGVQGEPNSADKNVEMWKIKKLIKSLEAARGLVLVHFFVLYIYQQHCCRVRLLFAFYLETIYLRPVCYFMCVCIC